MRTFRKNAISFAFSNVKRYRKAYRARFYLETNLPRIKLGVYFYNLNYINNIGYIYIIYKPIYIGNPTKLAPIPKPAPVLAETAMDGR